MLGTSGHFVRLFSWLVFAFYSVVSGAVEPGEFCVNNRLHNNAAAVSSNLSFGLSVQRQGAVVYPEDDDVFHLPWRKKLCLSVEPDEVVVLYKRKLFGRWEQTHRIDTQLLNEVELEIGRAGRVDQFYGVNYKYEPDGNWPSPSSWMMALYANNNTPLKHICIPGTHSSGSYEIGLLSNQDPNMDQAVRDILDKLNFAGLGLPVKGVLSRWARTQNLDTYEQLNQGARYLDIRARMINDRLVTAHQLEGATLASIIGDVRRFVEEQPGEIVVFHINETNGMSSADRQALYNLLRDELGERLAPPAMGTDVTIPQLLEEGRQVIVVARNSYDDPMIWSWGSTVTNTWYDKNRPDELLESLRADIGYRRDNMFHVAQMILTPKDSDIKKMISPVSPGTLEDMVSTLRYPSGMMKYLVNAAGPQNKQVNIILQDFIETSDIFQACMGENRRNLERETIPDMPES